MESLGFITDAEAEKAKKEEVKFADIIQPIKAPHFVLYIRDYLQSKYGEDFLKERGLKVFTSLDWDSQQAAEKAVEIGAKNNEKYRAYNASLVAIDPKNGEVLAMVGSKDYFGKTYPEGCIPGKNCLFEPNPNVALLGRQPGSAFKPFIYATAFSKGYDDQYIVTDEQTNFGSWGGKDYIPQNYDGKFRGPVTLRQALAQSLNVPSVKVLLNLADSEEIFRSGEEPDSIKTAKNLGITTLKPPYGPSIVLGGWEVKLLDMVSAYGVFAEDGLKVSPVFVLKIEDSEGNIIEENHKDQQRVLDAEVARLINDILSDNTARAPIFGLRSPMYFDQYKVAAKTGTTEGYKDGWIIGYTHSIVAGVWVGNNDGSLMQKEPGIVLAGPIWRDFMNSALLKLPKENFQKPTPKVTPPTPLS
jgi:membrane peptidoglycan carboxypeptidase